METLTRATIGEWFDAGVRDGADFMIVARDTFEDDDYPEYVVGSAETAAQRAQEIERKPMYRVLEIYALGCDRDAQLAMKECWAAAKPEAGPETRLLEEGLELLTRLRGWKA